MCSKIMVPVLILLLTGLAEGSQQRSGPCDPLVPELCALPFPSNYYLDSTDCGVDSFCETWKTPMMCHNDNSKQCTGFVNLTDTLPKDIENNKGIDASSWTDLDGFSPISQITTYFDRLSDATLPPNCPRFWNISVSLTAESCTVLIDATTGKRVAHWMEVDESFGASRGLPLTRHALTIWPAARLDSGHRYVIGIHGLTDDTGKKVQPSAYFLAMQQGSPDVGTLPRRLAMADVFQNLETHGGIERSALQAAWDFTVGSRAGITTRMLSARDDALRRVGTDGPSYIITTVKDYPRNNTARQISGIMSVPLYLNDEAPGKHVRLVLDAAGKPVYQGNMYATFEVIIPNSVVGTGRPARLVQYGHGLFGDKSEVETSYLAEDADRYGYIFFSSDWLGLAALDEGPVALMLAEDISDFAMVPDRLTQGVVNALCLMRMMSGRFANEAKLRTVHDQPVLVDTSKRFYFGNSLGGIMGGMYMSVTTDVQRGLLGVPGAPLTMLLPRSSDFSALGDILKLRYPDHVELMVLLPALQMLLDRSCSEGFLDGLTGTSDPLPNTPPHRVIVHYGTGDAQVSWLGAQTMARSIKDIGRFQSNIVIGNETLFGYNVYNDSAVVTEGSMIVGFDFGAPLSHIPFSNNPCDEETDSHEKPRRNREAQDMMDHFFTTGEIINTCRGKCYYPE